MITLSNLIKNAEMYVNSKEKLDRLRKELHNIKSKDVYSPEDIVQADNLESSIRFAELHLSDARDFLINNLPLDKAVYFSSMDKHIIKLMGVQGLYKEYEYKLEVR